MALRVNVSLIEETHLLKWPKEAVLVEAIARLAVVGELANGVHDAELGECPNLLYVHLEGLDDLVFALPHAVTPVFVHAIAGADGDEVGE